MDRGPQSTAEMADKASIPSFSKVTRLGEKLHY